MSVNYKERYATHPSDAKNYDTNRLRQEYLVRNLMEADNINLTYSQYDRLIVGGVVPVNTALKLETIPKTLMSAMLQHIRYPTLRLEQYTILLLQHMILQEMKVNIPRKKTK